MKHDLTNDNLPQVFGMLIILFTIMQRPENYLDIVNYKNTRL